MLQLLYVALELSVAEPYAVSSARIMNLPDRSCSKGCQKSGYPPALKPVI